MKTTSGQKLKPHFGDQKRELVNHLRPRGFQLVGDDVDLPERREEWRIRPRCRQGKVYRSAGLERSNTFYFPGCKRKRDGRSSLTTGVGVFRPFSQRKIGQKTPWSTREGFSTPLCMIAANGRGRSRGRGRGRGWSATGASAT